MGTLNVIEKARRFIAPGAVGDLPHPLEEIIADPEPERERANRELIMENNPLPQGLEVVGSEILRRATEVRRQNEFAGAAEAEDQMPHAGAAAEDRIYLRMIY